MLSCHHPIAPWKSSNWAVCSHAHWSVFIWDAFFEMPYIVYIHTYAHNTKEWIKLWKAWYSVTTGQLYQLWILVGPTLAVPEIGWNLWDKIPKIHLWNSEMVSGGSFKGLWCNFKYFTLWDLIYLTLCFDDIHALGDISRKSLDIKSHQLKNFISSEIALKSISTYISQSARRRGHVGGLLFIDLKCRDFAESWHL